MLSVALFLGVIIPAAHADTVGTANSQALPEESTPGVASISLNPAESDMHQIAKSGDHAGDKASAQTFLLASLDDKSTFVNACLSCDNRFGAGRVEIARKLSLLAADQAPLAIDEGIAGEDSCVQSEPGYDEKKGTTEGVLQKDWSGIGRDTAYFVGYQVAVIGFLYLLPESVTGWSEEDKKDNGLNEWWDHVKKPKWDKDKFYLNYLVHPYWGATYYIRARERGLDKFESFVYSALLSTLYEFGVEAIFEPPSYQDIFVTPIGGTLLGMYVFEPVRERIKAKGDEQTWYDKLALVLSDPLGAVSELTDKLLGIKSSVNVIRSQPNKQRCRQDDAARATACRGSYTGFELKIQW